MHVPDLSWKYFFPWSRKKHNRFVLFVIVSVLFNKSHGTKYFQTSASNAIAYGNFFFLIYPKEPHNKLRLLSPVSKFEIAKIKISLIVNFVDEMFFNLFFFCLWAQQGICFYFVSFLNFCCYIINKIRVKTERNFPSPINTYFIF